MSDIYSQLPVDGWISVLSGDGKLQSKFITIHQLPSLTLHTKLASQRTYMLLSRIYICDWLFLPAFVSSFSCAVSRPTIAKTSSECSKATPARRCDRSPAFSWPRIMQMDDQTVTRSHMYAALLPLLGRLMIDCPSITERILTDNV